MIQTVSINPPERAYTKLTISGKAGPLAGFPLLSIDRDSYVVQAEVQSGINFRLKAGCHCIAIGRGCSLADGITLMIDLNHDYIGLCLKAVRISCKASAARTESRERVPSSYRMMCGLGTVR